MALIAADPAGGSGVIQSLFPGKVRTAGLAMPSHHREDYMNSYAKRHLYTPRLGLSAVLALLIASSAAAAPDVPSIQALFSDPAYQSLKISPDGRYFGVIVPVDGRRELAVIRSDKSAITARYSFRDSNEEVWHFD